ncbi:MAG: HlyD family type I secretion periplasmic adaptor subunit [Rhodospirillales bacterium]
MIRQPSPEAVIEEAKAIAEAEFIDSEDTPTADDNITDGEDDIELIPGFRGEPESIGTHAIFALCSILVMAFIIWASFSELDIVSMTTGEVAPASQVKTVQHLEGGIVREIYVREGEAVTAGQPLVSLEPTATGADVGELQVRLTGLKADIARLQALIDGADIPAFDDTLLRDRPEIADQALRRFESQRLRHETEIASKRETVRQREQEIREINTRISGNWNNLALIEEQIGISEELLKENLTNRFLHLNLLKEASKLRGDIATDSEGLAGAEAAVQEAKASLAALQAGFEDDVREALEEARRTYDELDQRMSKFEDSLDRTVVRSPVDGLVKTLHVVTIGGVIKPGDPVVDVVPGDDRLIVEAQLKTHDIGYIEVGQTALIKLASSDAMRFDALQGQVVGVSPDTLTTPEGEPYYKVRIETEKDHFSGGQVRYNLFPGMQVMASIQTGTRTVMQYLLDPLRGYASSSMQER